jgi:Ca2+-binding RTX toxin-like protein
MWENISRLRLALKSWAQPSACVAVIGVTLFVMSSDAQAESTAYVADPNAAGGGGAVFRVDLDSGAQTLVSSGGEFEDPTGITAVGSRLFIADPSSGDSGAIIEVDPASGEQRVLSSGGSFAAPTDVAAQRASNSEGDYAFVVDPEASHSGSTIDASGAGEIFEVSTLNGVQSGLDVAGAELPLEQPTGIAGRFPDFGQVPIYVVDPDVGETDAGAVVAITPQCQDPKCFRQPRYQTVVSSAGAFVDPIAVSLAPDPLPAPIVADQNAGGGEGAVFGIGPNGEQTTIASGGLLREPRDLAPLPASSEQPLGILLADREAGGGGGALLWLDARTGEQLTVSAGGNFVDPSGVVVVAPTCQGNADETSFVGTEQSDSVMSRGEDREAIVTLGGDDVITADSAPSTEGERDDVCLGDGDDRLLGGAQRAAVLGGPGDDRVRVGGGASYVIGEEGSDRIVGAGGDDQLFGNHPAIQAPDGPDVVLGKAGDDSVHGESGNDHLRGGAGDDFVRGDGGNDRVDGGARRDVVDGGPGDDVLTGGSLVDKLQAGPGADRIRSRDSGEDFVTCGHGKDLVRADSADRVRSDCEIVRRR